MKKTIFRFLFFALILLPFTSCVNEAGKDPDIDEQIAQMLLVGFRGTELSDTNHIVRDIEQYKIGGVILYEKDGPTQSRPRNIVSPEQVKKLVADLKSCSEGKLIVAIDQEGGAVDRLKSIYGFPKTVTAQYLGTINKADTTRFYAKSIAGTLKEMGINLNFAPVVDLNVNPASPAIGALGRSFSVNPDTVVFNAGIFIDEHEKDGILSCCKHFPGHGSATNDSHLGLTDVTNTWSETELEPYRQLIKSGKCKMIMTAHVFNQNLDQEYPATLSYTILNGILKKQLGFEGVIVSDAMEMKAISEEYGLKTAIMKAINAGCDILVFSNNVNEYNSEIVPEAISLIHELVDEGRITEERIRQSYDRIINLKKDI
jgi:beta-N-acetylhexosaminidase